MPRAPQKLSTNQALKKVAEGLRQSAIRPSIYGYKPHPKQETFHKSEAKGRLFIGGNRSGKTVGGAVECVWWATRTHPYIRTPEPPVRVRAVSVDFIDGVEKIVKPEIARWMPAGALKGGSWSDAYDKQLRTLTLENGSFIEFLSYDQDVDKHAGTSRHFIWFDEEPPEMIYTENMMRLIDTGGKFIITMTPVEGMTWVHDAIYEPAKNGDSKYEVVEVDMTENPHNNPGEIDIFLSGLSEDDKKARKEGRFVQVGGLIYKNFTEKNIIDPFIPPKEWLWVAAMDHGLTNPTAWLWGAVDPEGRIFIFKEHYETGRVVSYHAEKVHKINAELGHFPNYYVGDPSIRNVDPITGTSILLEYMDFGVPIVLGNNDRPAGINKVTRFLGDHQCRVKNKTAIVRLDCQGSLLHPRIFITKNCENLIWELRRYRWGVWTNKKVRRDRNKKEEPHKKDDHACDALRYFVASRPEWDTGEEIPDQIGPLGFPVAVGIERVDGGARELASSSSSLDFHLGNEW